MKKLLLSAAAALLAFGASAANPEDVRIYINPGHGSWGPNNRHCATIGHNPISSIDPDTTDFYESNTNLQKGLQVLHMLAEYGVPFDYSKNQTNENPNRIGAALDLSQNIVMSHVKCGPYPYEYKYDYIERTDTDSVGNITTYIDTVMTQNPDQNNDFNRTLSVIAAEVDANNFDMFLSIHSNAHTDGSTVNYLYFCLDNKYLNSSGTAKTGQETEAANHTATSKEMSRCMWNHRILDRHTKWSHYDYTMTAADVAAGKGKIAFQNLGVLNHSVPGTLVEGYFHTYQPARHRAMNFDVCQLEGRDYARGIADYFGWEKESYGAIYGIVRDKHNKFSDAVYTPKGGTTDVYKPLNDVEVTLKDSEGNVVDTYTTDVNYNGAFVFKKVQPGNYTVEFAHPAYFSDVYTDNVIGSEPTTLNVTVSAATTAYPEAFLVDTAWTAPTTVYVNYPDSTAGKDYTLLSSYETKATAYDLLTEQLAGKTVRRQLVRDNKVYVLALDEASEPYIYLADLVNDTVMALDMSAVTLSANCRLKVSDIALTADHVLIASGMAVTYSDKDQIQGSDVYNGVVNFYKWSQNEETKLPETCELWFETSYYCNWYRCLLGKTITYSGTINDGSLIATGQTNTGQIFRIAKFGISDGQKSSEMRFNGNADATSKAIFAADKMSTNNDFELMVSPLDPNNYVFDGNNCAAFEWTGTTDNSTPTKIGENTIPNVKSNGANYFKYAGKSLMVTPKINDEGKVAGIQLFDITDGFSAAKEIEVQGGEIDPVDYTYASAHGELALTLDAVGNTSNAKIELFLVIDGQVTKFVCGDYYVSANLAKNSITGTANPYAYALTSEVAETTLKINYSLNADAEDVKVVIKDEYDTEVEVIEQGAQSKGAQTAEVSISGYSAGKYTWEVVVTGAEKASIERFSTQSFYHPSGLDIDNNPENASFGTLFVTEGYNRGNTSGYVSAQADGSYGGGLYIFDAAGEQVFNKDGGPRFYPSWLTNQDRNFGSTTAKTCGADFNEVSVAEDGRIFVNRYNFNGDYFLYAESLEKLIADGEFTSLLAGKTMTDGIYYEGSEYLAGPAQTFDVYGSGKNLKLIAISRIDKTIDAVQSKNRTVVYDLGTAATLPVPTAFAALDKKYTVSYDRKINVQYDNQGGVWYIQYRGTPSASEPALVYVDANGETKYFEGAGGKARYQGAISVSPDGNRLVASSASGVVTVYGIMRAENGDITLNEQYRLTHNMGGSAYGAAWDAAGNFFLSNASNEVVQGYALPRTEAAVTPAASKYAFSVVADGIDAISVDNDEDAPVEYYNLQGVKVENPSNGIFIKVQGKKSTKVYVK